MEDIVLDHNSAPPTIESLEELTYGKEESHDGEQAQQGDDPQP